MEWPPLVPPALRRNPREVASRLRQEIANLRLLALPPRFQGTAPSRLPLLPDPDVVCRSLAGTRFAADVIDIATRVMEGRWPLLGRSVDVGPDIHWRRDPVHGHESGVRFFRLIPYLDFSRVGDHKLVWEMNRHQHLTALAMAWRFTGDRKYVDEIRRQLESWWEQNPFLRGINWASALEVAFRAISWTWVYHLAGQAFDDPFRKRIVASLNQHGAYLEQNLSWTFSPNTHLLGEAVALHALGALFPQFSAAARWLRTGRAAVLLQMESQVRDDGSHFEQSSYYHVYALDMFLFHAALAPPPEGYRHKLRLMGEYLAALMGDCRRLPLIGDDDGGRWFHPYGDRETFGRATLATCGELLDCPEWVQHSDDIAEQAAWLPGPRAQRRVRPDRQPASRFFPHAGIFVMTSPNVQLIFDAGAFGPWAGGHSHSDTLGILARLHGKDVLVDSGTYTYVSDMAARNWFRGSAAHNTVRVDGRDQAEPAGPFAWRSKPDVRVLDCACGTDVDRIDAVLRAESFTHRRRVLFFKQQGIVFIGDEISGTEGEHDIESFWHLGHAHDRDRLIFPESIEVTVTEGGEHGRRSRTLGQQESAPVIIGRIRAQLPARIWTVLDLSETPRQPLFSERGCCSYGGLTVNW